MYDVLELLSLRTGYSKSATFDTVPAPPAVAKDHADEAIARPLRCCRHLWYGSSSELCSSPGLGGDVRLRLRAEVVPQALVRLKQQGVCCSRG